MSWEADESRVRYYCLREVLPRLEVTDDASGLADTPQESYER